MMATRNDFAKDFLRGIGAPHGHGKAGRENRKAVVAWIQAEGGNANYNPLNTTHAWPNATVYNSVGVKEYATYSDGVDATIETLNYGADRSLYGYAEIRAAFRESAPDWALNRVEASEWGTGGLAVKCLPQVRREWRKYRSIPISS